MSCSTPRSSRAIVAAARKLSNPIQALNLPHTLPHIHPPIQLLHHTSATLPPPLNTWMLRCVETELSHMYRNSKMSWDATQKQAEFHHPHQRFLLLQLPDGAHCAFLSFRWDIDQRCPVMYIYELFIEQTSRGRGVATAVMRYAELLCTAVHVSRLMLTVFRDNTAAINLYRHKLKYVNDPSCPTKYGITDAGYEILSKRLESV